MMNRPDRVLRELGEIRATAESDDGLIAATVDRGGRLRELRIDPRVYRTLDADELAEGVAATAGRAGKLAHRQAVKVAADVLPAPAAPDDTDLGFDLVLGELDRRIAGPSPAYLDLPAFRQKMLDLREQMGEIEGTARSDDGLIDATTDGYGRLRELRLDARLFRVTHSRRLAAEILRTVAQAADAADGEVVRVNRRIWG
jgi:DNA-binding protein YbaB